MPWITTTVMILITAAAFGQEPPDWGERLARLQGDDWRTAFNVGQELAELPPDEGYEILAAAWPKLDVKSRQQMLKAFNYAMPYPLHARMHGRILDVLDLGVTDHPDVQQWSFNYLKEIASQDFAEDIHAYRVWYAANRTRPIRTVMAESRGAVVAVAVADIAVQDLLAGGDRHKRYFLFGPHDTDEWPRDGLRLLLVLPGGDGGPDFRPFVENIFRKATPDGYLVAELVAPQWSPEQAGRIVWPTVGLPSPEAGFTTEQFIDAVIDDVAARYRLDPRYVFSLSWSSGGPAAYAASLADDSRITGSLVAMSVFKPELLPDLQHASGRRYYILHSPQDFIPMRFAQAARDRLAAAGATTTLVTYEGGHGWHGDVFGTIRRGLQWLQE